MVNITIDGNSVQVPEGTTVLRAAEAAGVSIPTLCDHKNLAPFGGCRLCLVEIEGARTLQPSCSLPVSNNMVVHTSSEKVIAARKFVLTLIFSDRNHFCPYCQVSGGDCELQNAALELGMTHWSYQPNWKRYPVDASHKHLVLDHNRCILCRRCVRACAELVGNFTLGIEERGAESMLICDVGVPFGESSCVSCGTCSQVCPTGAIIDRDSAYQGKESLQNRTETLCVGCSVGCGTEVLVRDNRLVRVLGRWNAEVNGGVLCEKGRFTPIEDDRERILTPMIRKDGKLEPASWDEAFSALEFHLKPLAGKKGGLAAIASTRLPIEALSAFKHLFADTLKSDMVTSLEEGRFTAAASAVAAEAGAFEGDLDALQHSDCVVTVGVNLADDHQVAGFMIKRILPNNTALIVIDSEENEFNALADASLKPAAGANQNLLEGLLAGLVKMDLAKQAPDGLKAEAVLKAAAAKSTVQAEEILHAAELIGKATHPVFVYGSGLATANELSALLSLAKAVGAADSLIGVRGAANSLAAAQLSLDAPFKRGAQQAAYVALGDDSPSQRLIQTLEGAPFLAVQASYTSRLTAMADVVLPVEMWAEQEGHYLNLDGRLQNAVKALQAQESVHSNASVLEEVSSRLGAKPAADWKDELTRRAAPVQLKLN